MNYCQSQSDPVSNASRKDKLPQLHIIHLNVCLYNSVALEGKRNPSLAPRAPDSNQPNSRGLFELSQGSRFTLTTHICAPRTSGPFRGGGYSPRATLQIERCCNTKRKSPSWPMDPLKPRAWRKTVESGPSLLLVMNGSVCGFVCMLLCSKARLWPSAPCRVHASMSRILNHVQLEPRLTTIYSLHSVYNMGAWSPSTETHPSVVHGPDWLIGEARGTPVLEALFIGYFMLVLHGATRSALILYLW